jgi:DNA modification methylase
MELADGRVFLHSGDCLEVLASLPENSIDAVVTDPPYELGFMGKSWDASGIAFCSDTWALVWRVLKPGGHMVAFGAPKNYHRLACAIEDAGFEIRDSLMWVFGTGFPKSHNISKAIDAAAGAEREVVGVKVRGDVQKAKSSGSTYAAADANKGNEKIFGYGVEELTAPATDKAKQWDGWGTALKPAYEPIVLARKPLSEKTVAANVLRWGTGALNINATRVGSEVLPEIKAGQAKIGTFERQDMVTPERVGRWPATICHDGSQQVLDLFPHTKNGGQNASSIKGDGMFMAGSKIAGASNFAGDEGSAARFFYSAKASKADRAGSKHPTVKPVALMQWLVRMVTPPGGTVLDPFAGSGTTGQAAVNEGFQAVLIEREEEYQSDIRNRLSA